MSGICSTPNMPRGTFRLGKNVRYVVHTEYVRYLFHTKHAKCPKNVRHLFHTKECPVCVPHQTCHVALLDWGKMSGMWSTPLYVRYLFHTKHATWRGISYVVCRMSSIRLGLPGGLDTWTLFQSPNKCFLANFLFFFLKIPIILQNSRSRRRSWNRVACATACASSCSSPSRTLYLWRVSSRSAGRRNDSKSGNGAGRHAT